MGIAGNLLLPLQPRLIEGYLGRMPLLLPLPPLLLLLLLRGSHTLLVRPLVQLWRAR